MKDVTEVAVTTIKRKCWKTYIFFSLPWKRCFKRQSFRQSLSFTLHLSSLYRNMKWQHFKSVRPTIFYSVLTVFACVCCRLCGKHTRKNTFDMIRMQVIMLIQLAFDPPCQSQSERCTLWGLQIKHKGWTLISPLVWGLCVTRMNREITAHKRACSLLHWCRGAGDA